MRLSPFLLHSRTFKDPSDSHLVQLVSTLRQSGVRVVTQDEVGRHLRLSAQARTALLLAAVEQVLLAGGSPFYFSVEDPYADQVITLREHLGMTGASGERDTWTTHAYVPAEEKEQLLGQQERLSCQLGPEV